MKTNTYSFILLFILLPMFGFSQLVNGSFETSTCDDQSEICATLTPNGCTPGWFVSHGTPQNLNSPDAPDMQQLAFMWSKDDKGEGIFQNFNFREGIWYDLCFHLKTEMNTSGARIKVVLTDGLVNSPSPSTEPDGCGEILPEVITMEIFNEPADDFKDEWTQRKIIFKPTNAFTQLWVFPIKSSSNQVNLKVDNFLLGEKCLEHLVYDEPGFVIPIGVNAVRKETGTIIVNNGNHPDPISVNPNEVTELSFGYNTVLKPNFIAKVNNGGSFRIYKEGCEDPFECTDVNTFTGSNPSKSLKRTTRTMENIPQDLAVDSFALSKKTMFCTINPNPFSKRTSIQYSLNEDTHVSIMIFDMYGTRIHTLKENELHITGDYNLEFEIDNIKGGTYFCRIETATFSQTIKMILMN